LVNTNNNWQNLIYHDAMQTGVNAGVSGGSEKELIIWILVI
jgi:hypothetical protein